MGAGDHQAGTLFGILHIDHIHLDALTLGEGLIGDLLGLGQHGFAVADLQRDIAADGIDPQHLGGDDIVLTALVLLQQQSLFRLTDPLMDRGLCRLRRDASELFWVQRDLQHLTGSDAGLILGGICHADLGGGVLDLLHNVFAQRHIEATGLGVDLHDAVFAVEGVFLDRLRNGGLDLFDHVIHRYALFLFQQLQGIKEVEFLLLFLLGSCSAHFPIPPLKSLYKRINAVSPRSTFISVSSSSSRVSTPSA